MIIGLDVGGTHTDVVLLNSEGLLQEAKIPTDPADLFTSVLKGLEAVTAGADPRDIRRIVLSTTLTTNAVIQNQIPAVGMIVCAGPGIDPESYRTHADFLTASGSIDHRGREVDPIRPEEIRRAAAAFRKKGIRQVGVVGKFSVRNPQHELAIEGLLGEGFDKVFLGHRISGNLNFGRRIATTYLNAAVYPLHCEFYSAVERSLEAKGFAIPLRLLKADGGNMKLSASIGFPAQTIWSGPAASVMGAVAMAAGEDDALVMDIGGTTTDIAVLVGRAPVLDPQGIAIGRHKTLIRSLETLSIGLGGDSEVGMRDGALFVGPLRRGPAMIYGGRIPTPTDAFAVLGEIPSAKADAARGGLAPLAERLGLSIAQTAERVIETACRQVLAAAEELVAGINRKPVYTVHELMEGYRVQPQRILVLGGPAMHFAKPLARAAPHRVEVVPRCHVANAIGAALARTTCEVTLFADTEQRVASAPQENFSAATDPGFDLNAAEAKAFELLRAKALERGANPDFLEMELVESQQFSMVRGFHTTGKNLRVRAQVKPGLIHGYDALLRSLAAGPAPGIR
jgi:N-methylhydantoinase A/oxoprolinase/acetone carboxylase beta subunit